MFDRCLTFLKRPLGAALLATATLLSACGGGGDEAALSETATSYTEGQVTGYGSVVVNGVRFDDRLALVEDEDGERGVRADIKIGMWVVIEGDGVDRNRGVGRALRLRWANEFIGPVGSVDPAASTFVLFGQTIEVSEATQFEGFPGGLADLQPGAVVEVHGRFNAAAGRYLATRVEAEPAAPVYRLRGIVSQLDTQAKTFRLGTETIHYGAIDPASLPVGLADGLRVRVRLQTTPNGAGQWEAITVRHGVRKPVGRLESEIEGTITQWTSGTSFEVNGIPVDAATAFFRDGQVRLGDAVEVKGTVADGVLTALLVKKEDDDNAGARNELHGTVGAVDRVAETFVLHHEVHGDITVSYDHLLAFENGVEADLVPGAAVEVRGRLMLRGVLQATRVRFEDGTP